MNDLLRGILSIHDGLVAKRSVSLLDALTTLIGLHSDRHIGGRIANVDLGDGDIVLVGGTKHLIDERSSSVGFPPTDQRLTWRPSRARLFVRPVRPCFDAVSSVSVGRCELSKISWLRSDSVSHDR